MARDDPTIYMRIPAELKQQLEDAASENRRSVTAEVVARLQDSFQEPPVAWRSRSSAEQENAVMRDLGRLEHELGATASKQDFLRDQLSMIDSDEPGAARQIAALRGDLMSIWKVRDELEQGRRKLLSKLEEIRASIDEAPAGMSGRTTVVKITNSE